MKTRRSRAPKMGQLLITYTTMVSNNWSRYTLHFGRLGFYILWIADWYSLFISSIALLCEHFLFEQARVSVRSVIAQLFLWRCVAVRIPASQVARMVIYAWCSCLLGQNVPYPVTKEGAKWLITCC